MSRNTHIQHPFRLLKLHQRNSARGPSICLGCQFHAGNVVLGKSPSGRPLPRTPAGRKAVKKRLAMPPYWEEPKKSPAIMQYDALRGEELPDDIGLLPGTLVFPSWANLPKSLQQLPWMYWARLYHRGKEALRGFIVLKTQYGKPRFKYYTKGQRIAEAKELYAQMYTALAAGNRGAIESIACSGLVNDLTRRINTRKPSEAYEWKLHKFHGSNIKVCSDRIAVMPDKDDTGHYICLRQCIVRLASTQSLRSLDGSANSPADGKENTVEEYVVMQKIIHRRMEGKWRIWGTTEETVGHEAFTQAVKEGGKGTMDPELKAQAQAVSGMQYEEEEGTYWSRLTSRFRRKQLGLPS